MVCYVLEVVKFNDNDNINDWISLGGKCEHVGYMKAKFKTKNDACSYYDRHNPHMRGLNAHKTYRSDWDPITKLLYIVREEHMLTCSIDPFDKNDLPKVSVSATGSVVHDYKWLK
jgi:hypothetical protein